MNIELRILRSVVRLREAGLVSRAADMRPALCRLQSAPSLRLAA